MNNLGEFLELLGILIVSGMTLGFGFVVIVATAFWIRNKE